MIIKEFLRNEKEIIKDDVAQLFGTGERVVRHYLAELKNDVDPCIFIPTYEQYGQYRQIEHCSDELRRKAYQIQKKSLWTQFKNNLLVMDRYLSDELRQELYQFKTLFTELEKEENNDN